MAPLTPGSLMLDAGCHWAPLAGVERFLRMRARACITYSRTYVPVRAQIGNLKDAMGPIGWCSNVSCACTPARVVILTRTYTPARAQKGT